MIQRYSRPEMRAIWTDENKLRIWLQIELLASEALVKEGVVPEKDFAKIKAGAEQWHADPKGFVERAKEIEKLRNHDVIAFTEAVAEKINDTASRWFHFGLTSSDIVDTAFAVQMVQSADILIADVEKLLPIIARRANEHKMTPCIGRSHGIHGEPTTFGLKLANMHYEIKRALDRLKRIREFLAVSKLSGSVGTNAHLSPAVDEYVCKKIGLRSAHFAKQFFQRDLDDEYMNTLEVVEAGIERWAVEFRHFAAHGSFGSRRALHQRPKRQQRHAAQAQPHHVGTPHRPRARDSRQFRGRA